MKSLHLWIISVLILILGLGFLYEVLGQGNGDHKPSAPPKPTPKPTPKPIPKPTPTPKPVKVDLTGRITTIYDEPLSGAEIKVELSSKPVTVVWTDAQGAFKIPALIKGETYTLTPKKSGYIFTYKKADKYIFVSHEDKLEAQTNEFSFYAIPLCINSKSTNSKKLDTGWETDAEARVISVQGQVNPRDSGCKDGFYYNEYSVALSTASRFSVKVTPLKNIQIHLLKGDEKVNTTLIDGEINIDSQHPLPGNGNYKLRVLCPYNNTTPIVESMPFDYELKLTYKGFTVEGYRAKVVKILKASGYDDKSLLEAIDKLLKRKNSSDVDTSISELERILNLAPEEEKRKSWELIATLYANHNLRAEKLAEIEKHIRLALDKGVAVNFRITHDTNKGLPIRNPKNKNIQWSMPVENWLKLERNGLQIGTNGTLYFNSGNQSRIRIEPKIIDHVAYLSLLEETDKNSSINFIVGSNFPPENDPVLNLLKRLITEYAGAAAKKSKAPSRR